MREKTLDLKTVCECNRCLHCKTLHPQVSLINLENQPAMKDDMRFEFYAILLIEDTADGCSCCGRKYYDYSNATMVFLKPGEIFRMSESNTLPDKGYLFVFHPDLLFRTTLDNHIGNYTFFRYAKEEALHLSQRETEKITCCLWNIEEELHHAIDTHTSTILSRHIELLLDYCTRYYERQFITREARNKAILEAMGKLMDEYIASDRLAAALLPMENYFARHLGISVAYFCDLLKFETGRTFDEYFRIKRLEAAKRLLLVPGNNPVAVARRLGYPSVQYFSLLFKRLTGLTPNEYRQMPN